MLLEDIKQILTDANIVGTGTDWEVFGDHLPDSPDKAVGLFLTRGRKPSPRVGLDRPGVQIIARGQDVEDGGGADATQVMQDIYDHLQAYTNTINGTKYDFQATNHATKLREDDNGRPYYTQDYRITHNR